MDAQVEAFYRKIFAENDSNGRQEAHELTAYFEALHPPPDKLVWLRATAFRIGTQYLSGNHDKNVSLLHKIDAICNALEHVCMTPTALQNTDKFDAAKLEPFYQDVYKNHATIDKEENIEIVDFFSKVNPPPVQDLNMVREMAFKCACEFLSTNDNDSNVRLFRCINVVIHAFESVCLQPKPFKLKATMTVPIDTTNVDIQHAVQKMYDLDVNRLTPDDDYFINVQKGKRPFWKEDDAPDPLFTSVNEDARQRPTYAALIALLEHYSDTDNLGTKKIVTDPSNCKQVWTFLHAIMQTSPMQYCHKYCHAHSPNRVPSDPHGFVQLLHKIWFERYPRTHGGRIDSSGFEHVFVGEINKDNEVSGFHNWVRLYLEEKCGRVDYRGYIKPKSKKDALADSNDHVLTLQFFWKGAEKVMGTSFIGTSPEFEMGIYTTCFLCGEEENAVDLDTGTDLFGLNVKCYTMGRNKIGSSYPEATSHHEE